MNHQKIASATCKALEPSTWFFPHGNRK